MTVELPASHLFKLKTAFSKFKSTSGLVEGLGEVVGEGLTEGEGETLGLGVGVTEGLGEGEGDNLGLGEGVGISIGEAIGLGLTETTGLGLTRTSGSSFWPGKKVTAAQTAAVPKIIKPTTTEKITTFLFSSVMI